MTLPMRTPRPRGYTLIEILVTIAIIGIMMALAMPYFGGASTAARERSVVAKMQQDFDWARSAAGAGDAGTLGVTGVASGTGAPTVTMTIGTAGATSCIWTVFVNGTADTAHSMSSTQLSTQAPNLTCTPGAAGFAATTNLVFGTAFTLYSTGFVSTSGTMTVTGSLSSWPLQILYSGSILNTKGAT